MEQNEKWGFLPHLRNDIFLGFPPQVISYFALCGGQGGGGGIYVML